MCGDPSDAFHDVLGGLRERFPAAGVVFCPSVVQGMEAPAALIRAILTLNDVPEVDVIVVARGGGSVADLAAFDDEELCRIAARSPVPVVAAVGTRRTVRSSIRSPSRRRASRARSASSSCRTGSEIGERLERAAAATDVRHQRTISNAHTSGWRRLTPARTTSRAMPDPPARGSLPARRSAAGPTSP